MRKREVDALASILTDPQNSARSAEEVAALCIEAMEDSARLRELRAAEVERIADRLVAEVAGDRVDKIPARLLDAIDERRARTHRLAVVGQIRYGPQEETHTVVLGPFSCQGTLDSEEKLKKALAGNLGAREVAQYLAWDPASKVGRGRFMFAPMFHNARDAWDFYRGGAPAQAVAEVAQILPRDIVPVCSCGLKHIPPCRFCGKAVEHHCPKHEPGAEIHRCSTAA